MRTVEEDKRFKDDIEPREERRLRDLGRKHNPSFYTPEKNSGYELEPPQERTIRDTVVCDNPSVYKGSFQKIPTFDGHHFDRWMMEVKCGMKSNVYPEYTIIQAIRNSLKGDTKLVL
ncbi:hypothetical protein DPMN_110547 [Dreissena polymorpha]|uniref:Uncharacterized protein n=1 Tax=Dreissena polymorpha TaxID=45954 RepID=A0A9D4QNZ0_DREPO|nr:hypothetical protein DPMN_110547 [Dreissena polymorpha]